MYQCKRCWRLFSVEKDFAKHINDLHFNITCIDMRKCILLCKVKYKSNRNALKLQKLERLKHQLLNNILQIDEQIKLKSINDFETHLESGYDNENEYFCITNKYQILCDKSIEMHYNYEFHDEEFYVKSKIIRLHYLNFANFYKIYNYYSKIIDGTIEYGFEIYDEEDKIMRKILYITKDTTLNNYRMIYKYWKEDYGKYIAFSYNLLISKSNLIVLLEEIIKFSESHLERYNEIYQHRLDNVLINRYNKRFSYLYEDGY